MHFGLAETGGASVTVYDLRGARVGESITGVCAAGPHDVTWSARGLAPGVYAARLDAGGKQAVVKLVHVHQTR